MPSLKEERLQERIEAVRPKIAKARQLAELAESENRPMTSEEEKTYSECMSEGRSVADAMKQYRHDQQVFAVVKDLSDNVIGGMGGGDLSSQLSGAKSGRLSFKGMGTSAASKIRANGPDGAKALATSGTVVTEQTFTPDPVALGKVAVSLLDVIPVTAHASDQFAYLRQSVRTNTAAIVPEGSVKPTSIYTVVRIEDRLDVVAHLSEPIPRLWIADNAALQQFLESEMEYGLSLAVQAMVISDVAGTSGIQSQAYSTSVLQTLRKSLTKLETTGYAPGAIALNPTDFEGIELALSTVTAIEHLSLPFDAVSRRLFGVPLVVTNAVTAGVSYTLAVDAVGLNTDTLGVQVAWSETSNADDWSKNLIRARVEGRFATSVFSPLGVVVGDLTP